MCCIPNMSSIICNNEESEKRHKMFVLYFQGLDIIGIPYGTLELEKKAKELGLPVPSHETIKKWRLEKLEGNNMKTEEHDNEKKIIENEVKDALQARDITLEYFARKGTVILTDEIKSITMRNHAWIVTIDGKTFTGAIVIKSETGEIISANML